MYTHSYSFNPDIRLHIHPAECTVRALCCLIKQAGIIILIILNLWETPGIEQQIYHLTHSETKIYIIIPNIYVIVPIIIKFSFLQTDRKRPINKGTGKDKGEAADKSIDVSTCDSHGCSEMNVEYTF